MKRMTGLAPAIVLIAVICPILCVAQAQERSGLQVDLGIGLTSGLDVEETLNLGSIDQSSGATFRFGLTYRMPLADNFYLNPTFNMGFFNTEIDFGGVVVDVGGGQQANLETIEWKTTQMNFGVHPVYYFMPPSAKFRFYGGLGLKLNINSFGDADVKLTQGDTTLDAADGKTSIAVGPMVGFDYLIKPNMSIPFWLQYDMLFAEDMSNVFMVMTGATFYF